MEHSGLFQAFGPGAADAQEVHAAGREVDPDTATAPAPNAVMNLLNICIGSAHVAQKTNEGVLLGDSHDGADECAQVVGNAVNEPDIAKHEVDQDPHDSSLVQRRKEHPEQDLRFTEVRK